jgi:hypothetical protein
MALSGHPTSTRQGPLLGVKRTSSSLAVAVSPQGAASERYLLVDELIHEDRRAGTIPLAKLFQMQRA